MNYKRKGLYIGLTLLSLIILFSCVPLNIMAEGNTETESQAIIQGNLMMASVKTEGREIPEEDAAIVMELPEGTNLLIVGQEENGWYEIYYQGKNAYVPVADLTESTALDAQALEQEMQKKAEEDTAYIESLEMQRKAIARSKVWKTIIIVLIVAIFAVGIVSALKKSKDSKKVTEGKMLQE